MGMKGFICPEHGESPGRKNLPNYCVTKCTMPCVAPQVLNAMYETEKQNPHKGKIISASMLCGGCKRKDFLQRTLDYYIKPDDKLPTFRGTLVHKIVEDAKQVRLAKAGWLLEKHMELPVKTEAGEWTLSATLDCYDASRKTLYDVKTLGTFATTKLVTGTEPGTWSKNIPDSYVKQLNIYRYMAHELKLFKVERLRLQLIDFSRLILTGTRVKYGYGKNQKVSDVPDVPILSKKVVEEIIQREGDLWYRILFANQQPPVVGADYDWLCKICHFNGTKFCPDPKKEREEQIKRFDL